MSRQHGDLATPGACRYFGVPGTPNFRISHGLVEAGAGHLVRPAVTPCEQGIRQIHCQCKSVFRIEVRLPFTPPKTVPHRLCQLLPAAPPETTKFGTVHKRLLRSGCASKDHGNSNFPQACRWPLILSPGVNKLPWCPRQGSKRWPVCGAAVLWARNGCSGRLILQRQRRERSAGFRPQERSDAH